MQEKLFTIEEFRNYILSQDSLGDVLYNLNEESIVKANQVKIYGEADPSDLADSEHSDTFGDYDEDNFSPAEGGL